MEKNITLANGSKGFKMASANGMNINMKTVLQKAALGVKAPVEWLRAYYSSVIGRQMSMGQTWLLINTQLAFVASALPADMPLLLRLGCCVWLAVSLKRCSREI